MGENYFEHLCKIAREVANDPHSTMKKRIDAAWAAADADPNRRHLVPGEQGAPSYAAPYATRR